MTKRLQDKVAVITGGTSGIGKGTAELFVSHGCQVVIAGRSVDKGQAIADQLGDNCLYVEADVVDEQQIKRVMDNAVERFGKLDILFNNAGAAVGRSGVETITQDEFSHGLQLLLGSVVFGIKHAAVHMKAAGGGSIINNSSIAAHRYRQEGPLYSASKAAVSHYTRMAGVDLGPFNIRVNSVAPGAIATPIFYGGSERANSLTDEENATKMAKLEANLAKATPMPTSGYPLDIAEAVLFLASDEGRFVNCHDLVVDGGRIAMFHEDS
ncbi:MAG: glucose 1-dehydrogenase [Immundisolibacteraceae bacterium]|nr:glucose 1-dehydrogenase [Immundisolibacteraceae bacterium]